MFDKSAKTFPSKEQTIFMGHCAVSPLFAKAAVAMQEFNRKMSIDGIKALPDYLDVMPRLHDNVGRFLRTSPKNISYVHNTAEALCMIANGYPFSPGDEIISYQHEYPSNHYPWILQKKRGVKLTLIADNPPLQKYAHLQKPTGWSMAELTGKITKKTRIIAFSHVQYTSGFAADLPALGEICRQNGIDLVVDCAQSLGCLPVYPEEFGVSAVVASGWKWLMGPMGSGLLYTSKNFREKLSETMAGPGLMRQGLNYLDLSWDPHDDGKKFEYSTLPWDHVAALNVVLEELFLKYSMESIRDEVFRLQDLFLQECAASGLQYLTFPEPNRSGILATEPRGESKAYLEFFKKKGFIITAPVGYLRFAPHFYNDDEQMVTAASYVNEAVAALHH
ncbi:MAG: aminotransferase class V-fold PLP-dependent enzyme [Desulfocapsaceae bacterium]|nr:aminotransferase class V-fold PLP-dependent enzyme [Desulfocapsaceae bacterium]